MRWACSSPSAVRALCFVAARTLILVLHLVAVIHYIAAVRPSTRSAHVHLSRLPGQQAQAGPA